MSIQVNFYSIWTGSSISLTKIKKREERKNLTEEKNTWDRYSLAVSQVAVFSIEQFYLM